MKLSGDIAMTRRCFFATTGLAVAATGALGAREKPPVNNENMPRAALLSDGDAKTYLLLFQSGQEVMKGLLAFA
jgi:hypothetical protein